MHHYARLVQGRLPDQVTAHHLPPDVLGSWVVGAVTNQTLQFVVVVLVDQYRVREPLGDNLRHSDLADAYVRIGRDDCAGRVIDTLADFRSGKGCSTKPVSVVTCSVSEILSVPVIFFFKK